MGFINFPLLVDDVDLRPILAFFFPRQNTVLKRRRDLEKMVWIQVTVAFPFLYQQSCFLKNLKYDEILKPTSSNILIKNTLV